MASRREFFQSLIAVGATPRRTRKGTKHAGDIQLYHGPMQVPEHVAECVREDPTPHKATGRGRHWVTRYAEADGTVWLFRCGIPFHRGMVGEIVRTPLGRHRVHCWSAAELGEYKSPEALIARKVIQQPEEIMPPLLGVWER